MNLIFMTQGESLAVFHDVYSTMRKSGSIDKAGFYTAQSDFYDNYLKDHPDINDLDLVKEWDLVGKASGTKPDIAKLREMEAKFGDPVLWNAIVADRRLYLGKKSAILQDYKPRYSHKKMLAILQTTISEIEALFDRIQPDAVVGFICVTTGDYIAHLIAKQRNIPLINLRPTRVNNYFYGAETVEEPSQRLIDAFNKIKSAGVPNDIHNEAQAFIDETRKAHAMYEGVLPPPGTRNVITSQWQLSGKMKQISKTVLLHTRKYAEYHIGKYRHDNFFIGEAYTAILRRIIKPARAKLTNLLLATSSADMKKLAKMDYAFYPLHKEPEIQLLVYSRPFMNQIEVVRNIARSLPVGMKLVVKEHPASIGYRPLKYYRKLLEIPNVIIAKPSIASRELVNSSRLVAIVSGSIGFEAIILRKPVLYLGGVIFGMMSDKMIRRTVDLQNLASDIHALLSDHEHDENELLAYVAAVMNMSVPIDFYSRLLRRKGILGTEDAARNESIRQEHIKRLSDYILKITKNEQSKNK